MPKHTKRKSKAPAGTISHPVLNKSGRPAKVKKVKEVVFDPDARKEFLTGFSKRKKAREAAVRNKAIDREKHELREMRRSVRSSIKHRNGLSMMIREERKERAAQNVRNAKAMYGDAGGSDDENLFGSDDDLDLDADDPSAPTTTFESTDLVTTVALEPFSLSRSPSPSLPLDLDLPPPPPPKSTTPSTSSTHKRRVKNKPVARMKMSSAEKKERATGSKAVKAKYAKQNKGTKGRSNKG
ncbi:BQ2448_6431 [Microbotryum intermedium]|uniref:BQ2448_6431 protein n=1 Tax=Microbotryum intermedium TaxID=269621 RepID=A0A238FP73_9BASI|nr:BQ2448_6431 [Microbotryum intermedium]